MDPDESLVSRRSRRSTAGNRMEAALAELGLEDVNADAEDDIDFFVEKDEEDVFESDFESTDEEAAKDGGEGGDEAVQDEEKSARKVARIRVQKATALAHARQKVTFNPQAGSTPSKSLTDLPPTTSKPRKRRVSLGVAVNAETGEVISGSGQRQSQRKHTILNTSATVKRMKRSEEKKASTTKKAKPSTRALTQDELIARALDTEEGNIVEHRDYLKLEEEKRKRARVVRATVSGPLLRWVSRCEEVQVAVEAPQSLLPLVGKGSHDYSRVPSTYASTSYIQSQYSLSGNFQYYHKQPSATTFQSGLSYIPFPQPISSTPPTPPTHTYPTALDSGDSQQKSAQTEKVAKNYVVHELGQHEAVHKPKWKDTMESMFGNHIQWEELRVFVGKGRPLARPKQTCPITGRPACYLDPRSGVPFADIRAFRILTRILDHEYIWSDSLGCYIEG